jgi:hypothetical protein
LDVVEDNIIVSGSEIRVFNISESLELQSIAYYMDDTIGYGHFTTIDSFLIIHTTDMRGSNAKIRVYKIPYSPSGNSELRIKPNKFNITPYPNPFNSTLTIHSTTSAMLEIHDIRGNLIHNSTSYATRHLWQPEKVLPSGLYLIKTTDTKGNINIKKTLW